MQNVVCELVVSVKVYGFFDVTKNYVCMRSTLEKIDKFTIQYRSKEQFFNGILKTIKSNIVDEVEREYGFSPTLIELGPDNVFIRRDERNISPLFSRIGNYSLDDVILKRMYDGSLTAFYKCDQRRKLDDNYQTFFADFDLEFQDRIDKRKATVQDIKYFWNSIFLDARLYSAIRFLLSNVKNVDLDDKKEIDELYQRFCDIIPDTNSVTYQSNYARRDDNNNTTSNERVYRYPYIDD